MEDFQLKVLPILFVSFVLLALEVNCQCGEVIPHFGPSLIESPRTEDKYITVENIIDEKSDLKPGQFLECEVTKTKQLESSKINSHVFTQGSQAQYFFFPVSKEKKCFSVQIRTKAISYLLLSATPVQSGHMCHVVLSPHAKSTIVKKDGGVVSTIDMPDIVNEHELRGFWLRWLDDHLLEFGRDTDNGPILSYRFPEKIVPSYMGIFGATANAEWIIHAEPKCGPYNVTEKALAVTKCKMVPKRNLQNDILEKSQIHILNLIKKQHEIFRTSKFRSKEILLKYQNFIDRYFKNAEENQNKINAGDNEKYCPLKAKLFHEINEEYFQFLEDLQMELSLFKEPSARLSENLSINCSIAPKLF